MDLPLIPVSSKWWDLQQFEMHLTAAGSMISTWDTATRITCSICLYVGLGLFYVINQSKVLTYLRFPSVSPRLRLPRVSVISCSTGDCYLTSHLVGMFITPWDGVCDIEPYLVLIRCASTIGPIGS